MDSDELQLLRTATEDAHRIGLVAGGVAMFEGLELAEKSRGQVRNGGSVSEG